ncbi:DnaT-like ssDNA-binding protein [Humisphaera borealis]|uniref:Uncharacterized protein n=1 Tax=Humisphaera borealis TaxID=2807512 RepID=A0A7M2X2A8_9BACT|nr:DnaT-like ssDNA-binding protein [Humisphaera borealis]QOV90890.1 hypothetical protein IPV69_05890 [Humisphaera borealis]
MTIEVEISGDTPASVVLRDSTNTYGVKRTDTNAVVVAAGTAMVNAGGGIWRKSFDEPALGLTYAYGYRITWDDGSYNDGSRTIAGSTDAGPSYLTVATASAVLVSVPSTQLAAYRAASDADKLAALVQATAEIDAAGPWQGRRYDLDPAVQTLEFPRVPYERYQTAPGQAIRPPAAYAIAEQVWDWDDTTKTAVVPRNVKLAVLHQANAILLGERAARLDAQHDGLASQDVGSLKESYRPAAGGGREKNLVRQAADLLRPYRLKSGRIL